ncbi:hypothetical protein AX14_002255 [Amanita brunnescens Koide BX004]|nr:hypothetical protein AX14_002255 [Amanita brunnescens Koide BX004]
MTIAQVKEDLREGSAKFRDLVASIDAVGSSISVTEAAGILARIPFIRAVLDRAEEHSRDISEVSDSDAEAILGLVKAILPEIYKATDLVIQKKNIFAQLPNVFSLEGLYVPAVLGGTVTRLVSAQIVGLHARAMTVADIAIRLSPPKFNEEALRLKAEADAKIQQAIRVYSE